MQLSFEHFNIHSPVEDYKAGFLMHLTESETTARQDIEEALEKMERDRNDCWLDHAGPKDEVIDMSNKENWDVKVRRGLVAHGRYGTARRGGAQGRARSQPACVCLRGWCVRRRSSTR